MDQSLTHSFIYSRDEFTICFKIFKNTMFNEHPVDKFTVSYVYIVDISSLLFSLWIFSRSLFCFSLSNCFLSLNCGDTMWSMCIFKKSVCTDRMNESILFLIQNHEQFIFPSSEILFIRETIHLIFLLHCKWLILEP